MKFEKLLSDLMRDPEFKKEYEDLEPEFQIRSTLLQYRIENNISQDELAKLLKIDRADLSKLENGKLNPSVKTLKRIAEGLGKKLVIEFRNY